MSPLVTLSSLGHRKEAIRCLSTSKVSAAGTIPGGFGNHWQPARRSRLKNSAGARRWRGASMEGVRDSRSILRVLRDCSVHPQGPSLHSEPFIGTDARLVHRRNKMECLWVVRWVSRAKSSATPTNSPRLGRINIGVCGFCCGFDLGLFRWRTGTKPAQSNDGNRSRIGSIYDKA